MKKLLLICAVVLALSTSTMAVDVAISVATVSPSQQLQYIFGAGDQFLGARLD